jgi:GNAT superfamily N-acetyltransferase
MGDTSTVPTGAADSSSINLGPAEIGDAAALAAISAAAFSSDTHTQLKELIRGPSFESGMCGALESWITSPKIDVIVARDGSSGEPVGWVAWSSRGLDGAPAAPLPEPSADPETAESKTVAGLEALTNANMLTWASRLMPAGTRCRYICAVNVAPAWQGKGIGSRLIHWGIDKADAEPGVYCWVQSSMGGWTAFAKHGFVEVGHLKANLDDFAQGHTPVNGDQEAWGEYIWRYMRREARISG